jgi:hypothetical protein
MCRCRMILKELSLMCSKWETFHERKKQNWMGEVAEVAQSKLALAFGNFEFSGLVRPRFCGHVRLVKRDEMELRINLYGHYNGRLRGRKSESMMLSLRCIMYFFCSRRNLVSLSRRLPVRSTSCGYFGSLANASPSITSSKSVIRTCESGDGS